MALGLTTEHLELAAAVRGWSQRHCPADVVVWLDFKKGKYYSKGQRLYARGFDGSYVCREEARSSFYRRALIGSR